MEMKDNDTMLFVDNLSNQCNLNMQNILFLLDSYAAMVQGIPEAIIDVLDGPRLYEQCARL